MSEMERKPNGKENEKRHANKQQDDGIYFSAVAIVLGSWEIG